MSPESRLGALPGGALAARLVAIGGLFAFAVLLHVGDRTPSPQWQLTGLYAVVLTGFLSTLGYALAAASGAVRWLALLEMIGDALLITGLVYCTGGPRSLFGFVYIVWIVYAALRAGSLGAMLAPGAAIIGYALVTWGEVAGWMPPADPADRATASEALTALGAHGVAFSLVAGLAHRLARQIKRGEQELHELAEIHRRIFDNVSSGLLTVDDRGRVTSFNREAQRITGYACDEVLGMPLESLSSGLAGALSSESSDRESGALSRLRICFRNRADEEIHLGLSRSILRDSRGEPDGSVLIFQDLSLVVRMEEELRRSERLAAVGGLAAGLAHEIRNPLGSLSGAIELLERELPELGGSTHRLIRIVQRETARLNRLVSDFLSYARPGALRRRDCSLNALLEDVVGVFSSGLPADVRLELELEEELKVFADPDALRQIFWNLVLNAVQSRPSDGVVRVRASRSDAGIRAEVIDRGEGMSNEVVGRIFEPFFTTKPKGTGLGLATVHRLVEGHDGSLEVSSEPGAGTTIVLLLPGSTS